ncbi:hypothetical protein NXC14_CH01914 [Rhizobium sp. NXC14]|nr:hypothetical protein NXC14_CH01914 [Rhizobium sp. NXC14]
MPNCREHRIRRRYGGRFSTDGKAIGFFMVRPAGKIMPAQAANRKSVPSVLVVYSLRRCEEDLGMEGFLPAVAGI